MASRRAPPAVYVEISSDTGGEDEDIGDAPACIVDRVPISRSQMDTLVRPTGWLTDELINAFAHRVQQAAPDIHCCSTFFFASLQRRASDAALGAYMARWHANVWAVRSNMCARLYFVPVNWGSSHWALVVADPRRARVSYYDSMASGDRARRALDLVSRAFAALGDRPSATPATSRNVMNVIASVFARISLGAHDMPLSYECVVPPGQQQQTDGSSCGVFVCWRMALLARLDVSSTCDPAAFRSRISTALLHGF